MSRKIREILLVSSPYDAFIMEEDGSLAARIIEEYQGLNLSHPPRLQRVRCASQALKAVREKKIDLVITMPNVDDMDALTLGMEIKKIVPGLPVVLLAHSLRAVFSDPEQQRCDGIDHIFIWSTDPSLLLAIVKHVEDYLNVAKDTRIAGVRVLIMVEDSPLYRSYMLPLIYEEVVKQTQGVLTDSLTQEHRLLKMRARPKILVAENFEDALQLYNDYQPYVFGVIADGRFPRRGEIDSGAGLLLLNHIRSTNPDLPLLLMSAETSNREKAMVVPAVFLDKNSPTLTEKIHDFFLNQLGFGDFVFRMPDGTVVGWADNLRTFEEKLASIPEESLLFHATRNHFSNWIMARSEVDEAIRLQKMRVKDFSSCEEMRSFLVDCIHTLRKTRQKGIVVQFSSDDFDTDIVDFIKIGKGSIGGKARGLAFMAGQLAQPEYVSEVRELNIRFPKTLVISSDGFDSFILENNLQEIKDDESDAQIAARFLEGVIPSWLHEQLEAYLVQVKVPLSVRSSSLLEDAQFRPYAGLYSTYMLPNNHEDFSVRLGQFLAAVKLVYASTRFAGPRAFAGSNRTSHQSDEDKMAIIVQQMIGSTYGDYFYPAVAGVAQSHNFYPVSHMQPEDGIAHIAMGLGKTVVEGEKNLRFSPRYPRILPHFSSVDDILANAQRFFYALQMTGYDNEITYDTLGNLVRREVNEAALEFPVRMLASSYIADEHRIRDGEHGGIKILTFARILKHRMIPLPESITALLEIGRKGMGCPVEIEFAVDFKDDPEKCEFYFLQMRPMVVGGGEGDVHIDEKDEANAFCISTQALGHGIFREIEDIVYVKQEAFDPGRTMDIVGEIAKFNRQLQEEKRPFLLIGPGRWGSADRWLGIPVQWQDISGVGAMVELRNEKLKADPSQGTHFFHNITSMGIPYVTVTEGEDRLDWSWLDMQPSSRESTFLRHVRCDKAVVIKINGKESRCVMLKG